MNSNKKFHFSSWHQLSPICCSLYTLNGERACGCVVISFYFYIWFFSYFSCCLFSFFSRSISDFWLVKGEKKTLFFRSFHSLVVVVVMFLFSLLPSIKKNLNCRWFSPYLILLPYGVLCMFGFIFYITYIFYNCR